MNLIQALKRLRHIFYIFIFCLFPLKKNKIILWADSFKHFGCSPKYIALYLIKYYPQKFDVVWVFDRSISIPPDFPSEMRFVRFFSIEYLRELHTAKYIICNSRINDTYCWKKRNNQVYIQTWHSSIRLKKIEGDAVLPETYINQAKKDSSRIDLLISGCELSTEIFRRAFWYNGRIMTCGTPRCDLFFYDTSGIKSKVYNYFNLDTSKKLILYAPTFRSDNKACANDFNFDSLFSTISGINDEWIVACRLHPNIVESTEMNKCIQMTTYPDMQELLCASDILVTDYSSCMFDMMIAGKPCILFVPDFEEYTNNERGLYFDLKDLPFPLAKNKTELDKLIRCFDYKKYKKDVTVFLKRIGSCENGTAAKKIAEYIINTCN